MKLTEKRLNEIQTMYDAMTDEEKQQILDNQGKAENHDKSFQKLNEIIHKQQQENKRLQKYLDDKSELLNKRYDQIQDMFKEIETLKELLATKEGN